MNKKLLAAPLLIACYVGVACSAEDTPPTAPNGGSGAVGTAGGGSAGSGGSSAVGGSVASGGSTGGTPPAGGTPSSGGTASGGETAGGSSSGASGSGSSGGGAAGGGGASGGGGSAAGGSGSVGTPSAGCAKGTARPADGLTVSGKYYVNFPPGYDGKKPFPLIIGFHGCGDSNYGTDINSTEFVRKPKAVLGNDYVLAAPLGTQPTCWSNYNNDTARVKEMYDNLMSNYCIDTSRIFGTGHSSGAQYIQKILGNAADAKYFNFKAVAPVAGSPGNVAAPIPVMYVQGQRDAERGNGDGHEVVENFRAANKCMSTSKPYSQAMACKTNQAGSDVMVNPGCVTYDGCQVPTIWCSHNDPSYSNTMHDTPCFVWQAMRTFFESL